MQAASKSSWEQEEGRLGQELQRLQSALNSAKEKFESDKQQSLERAADAKDEAAQVRTHRQACTALVLWLPR